MKTRGSCLFNSYIPKKGAKKGGQTLSYPHEFDEKSDSKQFVTK